METLSADHFHYYFIVLVQNCAFNCYVRNLDCQLTILFELASLTLTRFPQFAEHVTLSFEHKIFFEAGYMMALYVSLT